MDSFGFAQVDFEFETENSEKLNCNTTYLPVLVIDSINNESVQRMVKTIYEKSPCYLFNNQQRSQDNRTLGKSPIQDLNGQIEVLGRIVTSYKENFRYFKTNAAFSLNRVENIKSYEKVKDISLRTLQYIAQHPEQLQKILVQRASELDEQITFRKKLLLQKTRIIMIYMKIKLSSVFCFQCIKR